LLVSAAGNAFADIIAGLPISPTAFACTSTSVCSAVATRLRFFGAGLALGIHFGAFCPITPGAALAFTGPNAARATNLLVGYRPRFAGAVIRCITVSPRAILAEFDTRSAGILTVTGEFLISGAVTIIVHHVADLVAGWSCRASLPISVAAGLCSRTKFIAAWPRLAICAVIASLVDSPIAIIVGVVSAGLWVDAGRGAKSPFIIEATFSA